MFLGDVDLHKDVSMSSIAEELTTKMEVRVGHLVTSVVKSVAKENREALSLITRQPMQKMLVRFDARPGSVDCHGIICGGCTCPELWFSSVGARCITNKSGKRVQYEDVGQLPREEILAKESSAREGKPSSV